MPAANSTEPLFSAASTGAQTGGGEHGEIVRQREVRLRQSGLGALTTQSARSQGATITFNFFADASTTVDLAPRAGDVPDAVQVFGGRVRDAEESIASVIAADDRVWANVWIGAQLFTVRPTDDGRHRIEEIDTSAFPPELEPLPMGQSDLRPIPKRPKRVNEPIDLLIAWTPAAMRLLGNDGKRILREGRLMVATANELHRRSGVAKGNVFKLVAQGYLPDHKESGNSGKELNAMIQNRGLAHFRNQVGADLVAVILATGGSCGVARFAVTPDGAISWPANGYSVSKLNCATRNLSFPHELGHNMSAFHDRAVSKERGKSKKAFNFGFVKEQRKWRTVMAYDTQCREKGFSCRRIPFFSTPEKRYRKDKLGIEIGQPGAAHNVAAFRTTRGVVAGFRSRPEPAKASVQSDALVKIQPLDPVPRRRPAKPSALDIERETKRILTQ
jgi:hypothetical protein